MAESGIEPMSHMAIELKGKHLNSIGHDLLHKVIEAKVSMEKSYIIWYGL